MRTLVCAIAAIALCSTLWPCVSTAQDNKSRSDTNRQSDVAKRSGDVVIQVADPEGYSHLQGEAIFSGPQPAEKLPSFSVMEVGSDGSSSESNPVDGPLDQPQVFIFQDETGVALRGLAGFMRVLRSINDQSETDIRTTIVFLGDDPASLAKTAAKIRGFAADEIVLTYSRDGRDGPGNLGLNRNVGSTIVLVKNGVVTRNFAMTQPMLRPDPYVLGGIAELIGVERDRLSKWLADTSAMPMRRDTPERKSRGD